MAIVFISSIQKKDLQEMYLKWSENDPDIKESHSFN